MLGSMRMVDEVVVGEGCEPGLDFKDHFLRIRPQLLVVTEDDKYGDIKRQLCAQVRCASGYFGWLHVLRRRWGQQQVVGDVGIGCE